jgi:hypothetical protein
MKLKGESGVTKPSDYPAALGTFQVGCAVSGGLTENGGRRRDSVSARVDPET